MITFPNYQNDRLDRYALFKPEDFAGASVLDLGCNEGQVLLWALAHGAESVFGIDYDPAFEGRSGVRIADLDTFDFATIPDFDIVLMLSVTHWVKNPERLAKVAEQKARRIIYFEGHQQQYVPDQFDSLFKSPDYDWAKLGELPVARPFYRGVRRVQSNRN